MCCGSGSHHGAPRWGYQNICSCGCLGVEHPRPRFISKKQRIATLEKHLEDLQDETKAVKEYIAEIKENL